ncbi:MAG: acyltransferase family protein [Steroidobacteraceae bacterium]
MGALRLSGAATQRLQRLPKLEYRPDIDGLRAIAVLAVVGFHAFPRAVPGGFVGVDVFFVISGFLISSLILKEQQRSTFSLANFYRRRARRILPALLIVLLACLGFGWYALLPEEFKYLGKQVAAAAVFGSNFALWDETGYFAPAAQLKPLLHLWSLGIEEQFYLCWPLLLMLLPKRTRAVGLFIAAATAASFALDLALLKRDPTAAFYFPLARFWELGLGCLLAWRRSSCEVEGPATRSSPDYHVHPSALPLKGRLLAARPLLPILGAGLIVTSLFCFNSHTEFPGWATLVPAGGALCFLCAPGDTWFQRRIMAHPAMVSVGLISYPLYLWHWPILSFAAILDSRTPEPAIRACCVLLSAALALMTYRFVERPIRTGLRSLRIGPVLASPLALVGIAGLLVFGASGFAHRFNAHVLGMRPAPRTDPLCRRTVGSRTPFNYCKRTNSRHPDVVFLGDSQTQAVYDGTVAALGRSYPLMLLGRGGCPPVLNVHVEGVYKSDSNRRSCNATWRSFVRYVQEAKPGVVVLVGDGNRFFDGSSPRPDSRNDVTIREAAFKQGLEHLLGALQDTSRVVYVREIPIFESAPSCYLRPVKLPGGKCSAFVARGALELRRSAYTSSLEEVQDKFPRLVLVDPIPVLCNSRYCPQELGSGELLYRDEMHLSEAGGRRFVSKSGLASLIRNAVRTSG